MISIFSDMVDKTIEVFMDDFLVVGNSFYWCLDNLAEVLKGCEDCSLVLNSDKFHFMVKRESCWGIGYRKKLLRWKELKLRQYKSFSHLSLLKV